MSLGQTIAWDDTVLPFQLDASDIRGRVARLDGVLDRILSQHEYPAPVEALVAEATILTALIGQTIKLRWKLSLQIRGDGPVRMIATDYFAPRTEGEPAELRSYAAYDPGGIGVGTGFGDIGKGIFALMIDQGGGNLPYQGLTPLAGGSLAACAATYFAQSEQLPTRFALAAGRSQAPGGKETWRAGGVLIQHMPKGSPAVSGEGGTAEGGLLAAEDVIAGEALEDWRRVNFHLDTVEQLELIGPHVTPTDLLLRLFHEEAPRVYDAQPVSFGCRCSEKKVRLSLAQCTVAEIAEMTTEAGDVTADCQFCGAHYTFDPATLGRGAAG